MVTDEESVEREESITMLVSNAYRMLAVRALTAEDPLTRRHALYLLGTMSDPDSIRVFSEALRDPEKAVRNQAMVALAETGEPAAEELIRLLDDQDWKVRYRAAEALGIMKYRGAVGPLINLLTDEKDHVRYMAAKSLGLIGDPAARDALDACAQDHNPYVRRMAGMVMDQLAGEDR